MLSVWYFVSWAPIIYGTPTGQPTGQPTSYFHFPDYQNQETTEAAAHLCPNSCSGHGVCLNFAATISCSCYPNFHGGDCSYQICPSGVAWYDFPSADNVAHAEFSECSNMGICDRSTGQCICRNGFTGAACESMLCPQGISASGANAVCSGHGRCLSLRNVANYADYVQFFSTVTYDDWDADKVYGCDCDDGWEGGSCSRRSCPMGDDPITAGLAESQVIECTCLGSCSGTFRVSFQGRTTGNIPLQATAQFLQIKLQELSNIDLVTVSSSHYDLGVSIPSSNICSNSGVANLISFEIPQGNLLALTVSGNADIIGGVVFNVISGAGSVSALDPTIVTTDGTTEYVECSNRGVCDYSTGTCACFDGFLSSDGLGNIGYRGDCGYFYWNPYTYPTSNFCPTTIDLETNETSVCAAHGTCDSGTGNCICDPGYGGPGCSEKLCTPVSGWFGSVGLDHSNLLECAGVGDCNKRTGICSNCGGNWGYFYGENCQYLSCETTSSGLPCSGNGECLSLNELAPLSYGSDGNLLNLQYVTPWDAHMVRGCSCFRAMSIDNQYTDDLQPVSHRAYSQEPSNFDRDSLYRGSYAFAATSWVGSNCANALCPTGINPQSRNAIEGVTEIQRIHCRGATSGTFLLQFRGNYSRPIPYNANAAELQSKLEEMYTIGSVSVTLATTSICNTDKIPAYVEFLTEFGDLPIMTSVTDSLIPLTLVDAHIVRITEAQKGTFVELECSGQGICDRSIGRCKCFTGFGSSNGTIFAAGERGDCSFIDKYYVSPA